VIDVGIYTPNRGLYKPLIGEKGWGDEVNQNWDILDTHKHERSDITDFFSSPFWDLIPDKPQMLYYNVVKVTSDYNASINDAVLVDASGGLVTITLPAPVKDAVILIKKIDTTNNPVDIVPSGTELIDGQNKQTLDTPFEAIALLSDGENWYII